jgi:hypothetical protein
MWNILLATSMVFFLSSPAIGTIDSRSPDGDDPKESPSSSSSDMTKKLDEKKHKAESKVPGTGSQSELKHAQKTEGSSTTAQKPDNSDRKKQGTPLSFTIKLALMADPLLFPLDLEIEANGSKVVLTGTPRKQKKRGHQMWSERSMESKQCRTNWWCLLGFARRCSKNKIRRSGTLSGIG